MTAATCRSAVVVSREGHKRDLPPTGPLFALRGVWSGEAPECRGQESNLLLISAIATYATPACAARVFHPRAAVIHIYPRTIHKILIPSGLATAP